MPRLLRACALALVVLTACDAASEPHVGSPGLEPPRGREDGGLRPDEDPGETAGGGGIGGGSGTPPPAAGTTGSGAVSGGTGGNVTGGGAGTGPGASGAGGAAGSDFMTDPHDGGVDSGVPFSELHAAELMKDCGETLMCEAQLGSDPRSIDDCLEQSAAVLDGDPAAQARFLAALERCGELVVCDYVNCATMP